MVPSPFNLDFRVLFYVYVVGLVTQCMGKSEDSLLASLFSFHRASFRDRTQVLRLGDRQPYPLNSLSSLCFPPPSPSLSDLHSQAMEKLYKQYNCTIVDLERDALCVSLIHQLKESGGGGGFLIPKGPYQARVWECLLNLSSW